MIYRVWLGKQTTLPWPLPITSLVQGGKTKPRQNTTPTTIVTSSPHSFRTGKEYITIDFPADEALHNKSVTIERVENDSTFIVPGLPFASSVDLAAAVRSPPGASVRCADASTHVTTMDKTTGAWELVTSATIECRIMPGAGSESCATRPNICCILLSGTCLPAQAQQRLLSPTPPWISKELRPMPVGGNA